MSLLKLGLDEFARLDSPLHRWEPRCKLLGLMALIFSFSFVQDLRLLPLMPVAAFALFAASRLPLSYLTTRLRYPGFFLLLPAITLPLLSGSTVLLRLGPLALRQEGSLAVLLIATRFISIFTVGLILFGTSPFLTTIKALRALGLPPVLADMTLLSYRYLYEIGGDLARMETAMGLRGFKAHRLRRSALGTLASLIGSLLVRSYERSERVYQAMTLRGYGRSPRRATDEFEAHPRDLIALGGLLLLAITFAAGEITLRRLGGNL